MNPFAQILNSNPFAQSININIDTEVFGNPTGNIGDCYYFISSLRKMMAFKGISLWDGQRSLDKSRVEEIKNCLMVEYRNSGQIKLRGAIILCHPKQDLFGGKNRDDLYYIIDGQHRLSSLYSLISGSDVNFDIKIRVDIIMVSDQNQIRNEFVNINKSVPVPEHYLIPSDIINGCCHIITQRFPKSLSNGKCKRPSINIDKFKDALLQNDIINKFEVTTGAELFNIIIKLNDYYKNTGIEKMQDYLARRNKAERGIVFRCFKKCEIGDYLFLGLFKDVNWVIDLDRYKNFFKH